MVIATGSLKMKVLINITMCVVVILFTSVASGSYLEMNVSSNPILPGLTKTLTMSCYIRNDNHRTAPDIDKTIDTLKESDTSFGTAIEDTLTNNVGDPGGIEARVNETTQAPTNPTGPFTTPLATNTATTNDIATQKTQFQVTSSPADVSHLMSIVITKRNSPGEEETIAQVTPYDPATALGSYIDILQVNGTIFHTPVNGELGYISLFWRTPLDDQVGTYTCEANALTHSGHPVTLTGSLGVQTRQPNVADLVPFIISFDNRISLLEQENQDIKHRLDLLRVETEI